MNFKIIKKKCFIFCFLWIEKIHKYNESIILFENLHFENLHFEYYYDYDEKYLTPDNRVDHRSLP